MANSQDEVRPFTHNHSVYWWNIPSLNVSTEHKKELDNITEEVQAVSEADKMDWKRIKELGTRMKEIKAIYVS